MEWAAMSVRPGSMNLRSNAHILCILLTWTFSVKLKWIANFHLKKKNHILIFPLEGRTWFSDFRNGETKSETQFIWRFWFKFIW